MSVKESINYPELRFASKYILRPVHTGNKLSPFQATIVALFGVAGNGDYSFGDNLSTTGRRKRRQLRATICRRFRQQIVISVGRPLVLVHVQFITLCATNA